MDVPLYALKHALRVEGKYQFMLANLMYRRMGRCMGHPVFLRAVMPDRRS